MSSSDGRGPGGQHPPSHGPKPSESPAPYDDPMARVLGLDAESSWGPARWLGYGLGGTLAMVLCFGGAYALTALVRNTNPRLAAAPQEIDVQEEAIPPPPPPPPTAKPEDKPEVPRAVPREAPPPPPAQAGKVLTREPDPNEPVDLTSDTTHLATVAKALALLSFPVSGTESSRSNIMESASSETDFLIFFSSFAGTKS